MEQLLTKECRRNSTGQRSTLTLFDQGCFAMKKGVSSHVLIFRRPTLRIFSSLVPFFTEDMFILVHCSIHTLTCLHIC
ncbi:hypothetical protein Hanom_Chr05g00401211 [Helianthus anomalus]